MSSKSSSASRTATNTATTDARIAADGGATVITSGGGNLSVTDGGAIALAGDVTGQAFDLAAGVADLGAGFALDALGFVQQNQAKTNAILTKVLDQNKSGSLQLGSQLLKVGIPAIVIIAIFTGWKK